MSTRTYQKLWLNYILPYVGWTLVRQRGNKLPPTKGSLSSLIKTHRHIL